VHHESFVFAAELEALADYVVDGTHDDVFDLEEKFARPIEAESLARHRDDVKVPDELFAGGGDEAVIRVDLAFLAAVALEHPEARLSARLREVREVDPVGDAFVLNFDDEVGGGVGEGTLAIARELELECALEEPFLLVWIFSP